MQADVVMALMQVRLKETSRFGRAAAEAAAARRGLNETDRAYQQMVSDPSQVRAGLHRQRLPGSVGLKCWMLLFKSWFSSIGELLLCVSACNACSQQPEARFYLTELPQERWWMMQGQDLGPNCNYRVQQQNHETGGQARQDQGPF